MVWASAWNAVAAMEAVLACQDSLEVPAPLPGSRGALGEDLSATARMRTLILAEAAWGARHCRPQTLVDGQGERNEETRGGEDAVLNQQRHVSVAQSVVDADGTIASSAWEAVEPSEALFCWQAAGSVPAASSAIMFGRKRKRSVEV